MDFCEGEYQIYLKKKDTDIVFLQDILESWYTSYILHTSPQSLLNFVKVLRRRVPKTFLERTLGLLCKKIIYFLIY